MSSNTPPATRRRVLMIQYIFPPIGGSAVYRNLSFVRYLPRFGWQPVVVCGEEDAYGQGSDPSLVSRIPPEAVVVRRRFVSAQGARARLKRMLGYADIPKASGPTGEQRQVTDPRQTLTGVELPERKPLVRRALAALAQPLKPIEQPPVDKGLYWALSIVPLCLRLIKQHQVDVVLSQSWPYSSHISGLILHAITGLPWVVDFHDPFTRNPVFQHRGWRRKVDLDLERMILRHADRITACTEAFTEDFRGIAPRRAPGDFRTITNGFDQSELDGLRLRGAGGSLLWPASEKVTLAHLGYVPPRTALPILQALSQLDAESSRRLRVVFVGGLAVPDMQWLSENPVRAEILFSPRVPMAQALQGMLAADALLVLLGQGSLWVGGIPGKLFDCMYSGTPILLSGPDGESARIIRESGTGCLAPAEDAAATCGLLRELARDPNEFRRRHYQPRPEVIAQYERSALAGRLAAVLDEACSAHRGKRQVR